MKMEARQVMVEVVGYDMRDALVLQSDTVVCSECATPLHKKFGTPIYESHYYKNDQHCGKCGKLVIIRENL